MKTNDIKKGTKIKSVQLGVPVTGIMMDNLRGNIRLVDARGSEVGMFDEIGSIYSHDIILAQDENGEWQEVEHTPAQNELRAKIDNLFN